MNDIRSTPPAGPATRPFALRAVTVLSGDETGSTQAIRKRSRPAEKQ